MDALTIHEAAQTTGWSPRMLRYIERAGLIEPHGSASAFPLYGAAARGGGLPPLRRRRAAAAADAQGAARRARRRPRGDRLRTTPAPRRGPPRRGGGVVRGQAGAPHARPGPRLARVRAGEALAAPDG